MTVAIGLVCKDGVLVASDSMGSDGLTAIKSKKVRVFGRTPAIWTASGSVFVMEEVTVALDEVDRSGKEEAPMAIFTKPDLLAIRTTLTSKINASMRKAYEKGLTVQPFQPGQIPASFATNFFVLGYSNGTPWFLEYAQDGSINWHTDQKFYATGSGGPFAAVSLALMSHYIKDDLSLEDGKLLAYRTIATTIDVSSSSVGLPVQIAVCDDEGTRVLGEEELSAIATSVERWKTVESDTLTSLRGGPSSLDDEPEDLPVLAGDGEGE